MKYPGYTPIYGRVKPPLGFKVDRGHPIGKNCVGCWLFNERSGMVVNDTAGNAVGTIQSSASSWGYEGQEFGHKFSGTPQHINLGNPQALEFGDSRSYSIEFIIAASTASPSNVNIL